MSGDFRGKKKALKAWYSIIEGCKSSYEYVGLHLGPRQQKQEILTLRQISSPQYKVILKKI